MKGAETSVEKFVGHLDEKCCAKIGAFETHMDDRLKSIKAKQATSPVPTTKGGDACSLSARAAPGYLSCKLTFHDVCDITTASDVDAAPWFGMWGTEIVRLVACNLPG